MITVAALWRVPSEPPVPMFGAQKTELAAARPDVIVMFDTDHLNTFFLDALPIFAMGVDRSFRAPNDEPREVPNYVVPSAPDLATHIRRAAIAAGFGQTFPELMRPGGGDGALLMMRFAFLVMMGIGFVDVTIGPPQDERERARMLGLLKKVVQREAALMRIDEFQFSAA